jgi:hypothetical protein
MGLNVQSAEFIHDDMFAHFRFPENLFKGSEARLLALRKALGL